MADSESRIRDASDPDAQTSEEGAVEESRDSARSDEFADVAPPRFKRGRPRLAIVVPCYDEEEVLPVTLPTFLAKIRELENLRLIARGSFVVLVDDGSTDRTWALIEEYGAKYPNVRGLRLSRNRGHQNALWGGLMVSRSWADVTISIDADGQDDVNAMNGMVEAYREGYDVVYGVRASRDTDTAFKRVTAQTFYKMLSTLGAEVVYNHADYRLASSRVLDELADFGEVNLYLRGMFPLVGFDSTTVEYERAERQAGESKYPLGKMVGLAADGVTSLSTRPLEIITSIGIVISLLSFLGVIWTIFTALLGVTVPGWASTTCIICFIGGIQLICLGVVGAYVGKLYMESKGRPRYIIRDSVGFLDGEE